MKLRAVYTYPYREKSLPGRGAGGGLVNERPPPPPPPARTPPPGGGRGTAAMNWFSLRKVRTPKGAVAGNACPPQGED